MICRKSNGKPCEKKSTAFNRYRRFQVQYLHTKFKAAVPVVEQCGLKK